MSQVKQEKRKLDLWDKPFQADQNPNGQNQTRNSNQQRQATIIRPPTQNSLPPIDPDNPVPNALIPITNPPNSGSTSTGGQRAKVRVARSAASNNPRSDWRPIFDKPQIILRPYQASIIESYLPQNRTLQLNNQTGETLNIQSSVITGVPGSGLSLMLAKQALDLNSRGSSSILLARNDIQRSRIAQMILDHAPEAERKELMQRIIIVDSKADIARITDPSNQIIIASPNTLNEILIDPELPEENDIRRRNLELREKVQRLLANIDNILVDDFHSYTGQVNDGQTATLVEVLKSSRGTDSNKLPLLLAVSSTPSDRGEVDASDSNPILNFENFFSPLAHQYTPDYRELIDKHYLKNPQPLPITTAIATENDRLINEDKRNLLSSVEPDSVNHQLIQIYQNHQRTHPGHKWRIIADSAEHANKLCRLFNAYGIQARTINHRHSGHFEQIANPANPQDDDPNRINIGTSDQANIIQLEARRTNRQEILNDYNSGDIPVLIDCEILQGINDSNTDVIAHWNFSDGDNQLLRSLGIAINSEARSQNIHWLALDPHNRRRLQYIFDNGVLDSNPFAPKGESGPSNPIGPIQSNDTIALDLLNDSQRLSRGYAEWLEHGIKPFLEHVYQIESKREGIQMSFEEAVRLVARKFITVSGNSKGAEQLTQDLILGKCNSPGFIRKFIEFAQKEYNYDLSTASYRVPELTGIRNHEELENSLKAIYPHVVANTAAQAQWLEHLDQEVLKIPREANAEQRAKYRIEALATILINLFVDKQSTKPFKRLEDGSTLNQAIRTFIGSGNNPKLLAMMMLDRDQDLRSLQSQFPGLFGTRNLIPFEKLKQNILARFPEMPNLTTDQKRKDFFLKTLYRETNIDYPALLDSSTAFFSTSAQPIIDSSIRAKIQGFLEEFYSNELSIKPELDARVNTGAEIKLLAESHLNDLANELIYSQLIAKIWDKEENTIAMTREGYFDLKADTIEASPIHEPYEDRIDLFSANIEWLSLLNSQLKRLDETSTVNGLEKRMARSFQEFIKENPELRVNLDRVSRVLSGTTTANETNNEDREIFAKYLEFINLPRNEARRILPHLVKAQSYEDIHSEIENEIKPNINANWQEHLQGLSPGESLSGLIADFIFDRYQHLFYDNENLRRVVNILAGDLTAVENNEKTRAENLCREFVEFIKPSALADTISRFPLLMGVHNKPELMAAIKFRFGIEEVKELTSDDDLLVLTGILVEELGLNIASMANLAELPNPESFYGDGIAFGLQDQKFNLPIGSMGAIRSSITSNSELIQARELLRTAFGEQYTDSTSIDLFTIDKGKNPSTAVRAKIQGNKLILESDSSIALNIPAESPEASITNSRALEYEYSEGEWRRSGADPESKSSHINLNTYLENQNLEWQKKLSNAIPDINVLVEKMISFITEQQIQDRTMPITTLAKILAANVETINENKTEYSKIFRAWVSHLGMNPPMDLAGVAAAFPKLTGIDNKEELIAAFRANSNIEDFTKDYKSRTNEGAVAGVQSVADKLGLSLNEMRIAAGLPNPAEFYAEPYRLINERLNSSRLVSKPKLELSIKDGEVLLSRELLRVVYGDEYSYLKNGIRTPIVSMWNLNIEDQSNFGIGFNGAQFTHSPDNDSVGHLSVDSNNVNLTITNPKNAEIRPTIEYVCKYENNQWRLETATTWTDKSAETSLRNVPGAQAKWLNYLLSKFSAIHIREQMQTFLNQHPDVQGILPSPDLAANQEVYEPLQRILLGNEAEIKKDPAKNTQLFRDWIAHLEMTLDEVIAEFPKLTGMRNLDELRIGTKIYLKSLQAASSRTQKNKTVEGDEIKNIIEAIGVDLGFSPDKAIDELYNLAGLPSIEELYKEPYKEWKAGKGFSPHVQMQLKPLLKAWQLAFAFWEKEAFNKDYLYSSSFEENNQVIRVNVFYDPDRKGLTLNHILVAMNKNLLGQKQHTNYAGKKYFTDSYDKPWLELENPAAQTKSIIDKIKERYSYEDFKQLIKGASDSGYAELSRIAAEYGLTFNELYTQAGLEDPSIKYNKSLTAGIMNVFSQEVQLSAANFIENETSVQNFFTQDAQRLKTLELKNAIWDSSMSYIKPLVKLQGRWYAITITGTNSINLLRANSTALTDAEAVGSEYPKHYTRLGKLVYNTETKTWGFKALSLAETAIDAIRNKGKEWYANLIQTDLSEILNTINRENNINISWDDLLGFYETSRTQSRDELLAAATALGVSSSFHLKVESQLERVIAIKILNKIFKAETERRKFIDIPLWNIAEITGGHSIVSMKTDCIDYAKLIKKTSGGETSTLKEAKLIDGQWVEQAPEAVKPVQIPAGILANLKPIEIAIAAIETHGKEWWQQRINLDQLSLEENTMVNIFEQCLKKINEANNINIGLDTFLDFYQLNKYMNIQYPIVGANTALGWQITAEEIDEPVIQRTTVAIILNKIFELDGRNSFMAPIAFRFNRNTGAKIGFVTNGINYAQELEIKTDGTTQVLKEARLIDGHWVVQEPETQKKPSKQELITSLKKINLPEQLEKISTMPDLKLALSEAANQFNLSTKEMFELLDIGFLVDNDGAPERVWFGNLGNFILNVFRQERINEDPYIFIPKIIGTILKSKIETNILQKNYVIEFPQLTTTGKETGLRIAFTPNEIQMVRNNSAEIITSRPLSF